MNPHELVLAALRGDDLSVRQLVKDAARASFAWDNAPAPDFRYPRARAVYAGIVELLASRHGQLPPAWTRDVGAAPAPVFLVRAAKRSPALRRVVEREAPAPLKKRNVLATAQYLSQAP
jgi:hypothetical protein